MKWKTIVRAFKNVWAGLTKPPEGRVVDYDPRVDSYRDTFTKGLTFARLDTILRNGDDGDITEALQLFEEIERCDLKVSGAAGTRRRALTRLDWEIVSAADKQPDRVDKNLADEAAAHARERLDGIENFKTGLRELARAIGPNLGVAELIWERGGLIDIVPIRTWRLCMKPSESLDIRVKTAEEQSYGIPALSPKFVVYMPESMSGSPIDRSLSRAQAITWLFKKLALSDWGAFCELFGMPVRVGKYDKTASDAEKRALKNMLENIGSRAWAMISSAVTMEFIESSQRGTAPFEAFINWLDREIGTAWLGGNLISNTTGGTGTYAAAKVQDEVRGDILDADIEAEADMVRRQILTPMVSFAFPGRDVPVPYFERSQPEDSTQVAMNISAWQKVGLPVGLEWARQKSGIPKPEDGEKILEAPDAFAEGITEGVSWDSEGATASPQPQGGADEVSLNELTLGIDRITKAGDPELAEQMKRRLEEMLARM